jgi:hypothetical protein
MNEFMFLLMVVAGVVVLCVAISAAANMYISLNEWADEDRMFSYMEGGYEDRQVELIRTLAVQHMAACVAAQQDPTTTTTTRSTSIMKKAIITIGVALVVMLTLATAAHADTPSTDAADTSAVVATDTPPVINDPATVGTSAPIITSIDGPATASTPAEGSSLARQDICLESMDPITGARTYVGTTAISLQPCVMPDAVSLVDTAVTPVVHAHVATHGALPRTGNGMTIFLLASIVTGLGLAMRQISHHGSL